MKIVRIDVFNFDLTYIHGVYRMSGGRDITSLPSTLVRVTADDGRDGWGEVCPLGTTYLPSHAAGARAALALMLPQPWLALTRPISQPSTTRWTRSSWAMPMPRALSMSLAGISPARPGARASPKCSAVCANRHSRLYFAVPLDSPDAMAEYVLARRAEGIHRFQLKIGGNPTEDADARPAHRRSNRP